MRARHITLTTGDAVDHRLDIIHPEAIKACKQLIREGGEIPGMPGYTVKVEGPIFTVNLKGTPVLTCGVGKGVDETWTHLLDLHNRFHDSAPPSPPDGWWIGVAILPGATLASRESLGWLADFEQCMAATIISSQ